MELGGVLRFAIRADRLLFLLLLVLAWVKEYILLLHLLSTPTMRTL